MARASLEEKIGQLFLIGFSGDSLSANHPIVKDIVKRNLGGVILFDRLLAEKSATNNIISKSQLKLLTTELQEFANGKLLIAVDQEGGNVNRFKEERGFPVTVAAERLGQSKDLQLTTKSAAQTAGMLHSVGINLNLSPVVDLNVFAENPIIGKYGRSFSNSYEEVVSHATTWVHEHRKAGVLTCLKHFPGHGSSRTDSHLGFVDITTTWQETELIPFQRLISDGYADAIMTGHLYNSNFDKTYPATLSKSTLHSLLHRQLQYQGVVISDDMQMKAITSHFGFEKACCRAISAGVDLLIIGNNLLHDPFIYKKVLKSILTAVENGTIKESRIEEAWSKIQKLKNQITKKPKKIL